MRLCFLLIFFFYAIGSFASPGDTIATGNIRKGVRSGKWTYRDSNSHVIKVEKYRKGRIVQTYVFNSEGKLTMRINRWGKVSKKRACGC
jgi:hypothetical protein